MHVLCEWLGQGRSLCGSTCPLHSIFSSVLTLFVLVYACASWQVAPLVVYMSVLLSRWLCLLHTHVVLDQYIHVLLCGCVPQCAALSFGSFR